MNVLSLFGGIETGLIALKELGIKIDNYYSSEIDKYSRSVSRYLHPGIKELGDISEYKKWDLPKIDLILAGPPCQGFSCSGKGLDWKDPRSQLFFTAIEILWKYDPKFFLFENVASMKANIRKEIDELMEVDSFKINSNLFSAQNRNRNYWTNLPGPAQIVDQEIFLKDILETEVDDKYFLQENSISGKRALKNLVDGLRYDWEKSKALTASGNRFSNANATTLIIQTPRGNNRGVLKGINGKSPTLTSSSWPNNNFLLHHVKKHGSGASFLKVSKKLALKQDQKKACTLTGGGKAAGDHSNMDYILYPDMIFRRFTPIETERLQTLADNTTKFGINKIGALVKISNTQRYKMTGLGWTKDAIKHLLKGLK